MTDHIKLPRDTLSDDLWRNPYAARLYFYLLRKADENGQWRVSFKEINADLKLSKQQYRTALEILKTTSIATSKGTAKTTSISLCNSESNRIPATSKVTSKVTSKPTSKFTPPTPEEAQAYIDKMGFHWGDANLFIDFNEQKGWRLSDGKPMRDWKAAMRNWENRWKQKYGNETKPTQDKYAARRGTDVGNHTASDYGGSF